MIFENKKTIIGCVCLFILAINIYNIPLNNQINATEQQPTIESNETIDLNSFMSAINNAYSEQTINAKDYDHIIASFWATWCPSCRKENIVFNEFVKKNKKVLVLGISVDRENDALSKFLAKNTLNFPAFNNTKDIAQHFDDIIAVPTHYIINTKTTTMKKTMGLL